MKRIALTLAVILTASILFAETRTWTSHKGKTIEAELVEFKDESAKLKKADGTVLDIRLDQLSKADQKFLAQKNTVPKSAASASETALEKSSSDTKLDVFAVAVMKEIPQKETSGVHRTVMHMGPQPGTTVSFLIPSPEESSVLSLADDSKIDKFVDEKKTDLLAVEKKKGNMLSGMIFGMPGDESPLHEKQVDEDGEWIIVDCHAPKRPVADSNALRIEGKIALRYGKGSKTSKHENVPLGGKGKIVVAGQTITVKKSPQKPFQMNFPGSDQTPMKMTVILSSKAPLDSFFSITFLDAKGEEIEFRQGMSGWMGDEHMEHYDLAEEVGSVSIEIEEYETIETVVIPVAQSIVLGFP